MLPALQRILLIWPGLKSYFLSQCENSCPKLIRDFFENSLSELLALFVHGSLQIFQETVSTFEKNEISATEVALKYKELKAKLKDNKFIPQLCKQKLSLYVNEGDVNKEDFEKHILSFYGKCISYLEMWEISLEGTEQFSWIQISRDFELQWKEVEASAEFVNSIAPSEKAVIDIDKLFDEISIIKIILQDNKIKKNKQLEEKNVEATSSVVNLWVELFKMIKTNGSECENFEKLMEFIFCLPGSTAPVERVFSLMNNVWSPDRNRLLTENTKRLLQIKVNFDVNCSEFYELIKKFIHPKNMSGTNKVSNM